jgi:hypothetical protein
LSTLRVDTPLQMSLHDHGEQRLVDPPAPFQRARVDGRAARLLQLGDIAVVVPDVPTLAPVQRPAGVGVSS